MKNFSTSSGVASGVGGSGFFLIVIGCVGGEIEVLAVWKGGLVEVEVLAAWKDGLVELRESVERDIDVLVEDVGKTRELNDIAILTSCREKALLLLDYGSELA